jgi:RimJ/RimL family protein N-acetyltransferase
VPATPDPSLAPLPDWHPARAPAPVVLQGSRVRLEPFDAARHADELFASSHGPGADTHLWDYLPYGPFAGVAELRAWIAAREDSTDPLFLAVVDTATDRAAGQASFLRAAPEHGSVEIGHIWIGAALQRTPAATEALALLVRHAFDALGNRRLEWKCDAANARSRRTAERLGFEFEGVFRQHMVVKGRNRDTAWFAILDGDWPRVRRAFDAWLAPENFDAGGRQRKALSDLR